MGPPLLIMEAIWGVSAEAGKSSKRKEKNVAGKTITEHNNHPSHMNILRERGKNPPTSPPKPFPENDDDSRYCTNRRKENEQGIMSNKTERLRQEDSQPNASDFPIPNVIYFLFFLHHNGSKLTEISRCWVGGGCPPKYVKDATHQKQNITIPRKCIFSRGAKW